MRARAVHADRGRRRPAARSGRAAHVMNAAASPPRLDESARRRRRPEPTRARASVAGSRRRSSRAAASDRAARTDRRGGVRARTSRRGGCARVTATRRCRAASRNSAPHGRAVAAVHVRDRALSEIYNTRLRAPSTLSGMKKTIAALFLLLTATASAADLPKWMAGSWAGKSDGVDMEENWTKPAGGVMLGMHRDVRPDKKTSFEFLRIEKRGDSLVYLAMPGGQPATEFPLKSATANEIVFENLGHDFP